MIASIGVHSWFGYQIPMPERAWLIREAGYKSVMLWWGDDHTAVDGPKKTHPQWFRAQGLGIVNIHMPFSDINSLWRDTLDGQQMVDTLAACLADCRIHEIPTAVMHLTSGDAPPEPNALGLERAKYLVDRAECLGVNLALENLRKPRYLEFIFDRIQSARLGFCYDSGHEHCWSPELDLLEKYGDKLMALHLHDNDGTGDQHLLPLEGSVPWARIMAHLTRLQYPGDLTLEIAGQSGPIAPGYTPEAYLAEGMRRAKRLLDL